MIVRAISVVAFDYERGQALVPDSLVGSPNRYSQALAPAHIATAEGETFAGIESQGHLVTIDGIVDVAT